MSGGGEGGATDDPSSSLSDLLSQIGEAVVELDEVTELRRQRLAQRDDLIVRAKAMGATWSQLETAADLSVGGLRKVLQRKGVL